MAEPGRVGGATFFIEAASVAFTRGAPPALADVTASIGPGEAVGLVGPSGAGKSTLLRLLNGAVRPTSGRVIVDGEDVTSRSVRELRELRARIGVIHQDLALVPNLRAISNVLCGRFGRRSIVGALRSVLRPTRDETREVHALLERVGVAEKLFERVDRLSGGQRQRVAIARAMYQDPEALLADEPVSSVDPARARDTIALLVDLSRERGLTLVASLHDLEIARAFFPRLIGLREGQVAFDRPVADLDDATFRDLYRLGPTAETA